MISLLIPLLAPAAEAADYVQLRAPDATASTFLKSNWNKYTENYHANYILDGNPRTAWVEGARGNGLGEWVGWSVTPVGKVDKVKLRLRNGYQKSAGLLTANASPALLSVTLTKGGDLVHETTWELDATMGWQELELDPEKLVAFDGVRLNVLKVHEGRSYADLCISDAEVWVQSAMPYSAPVENAKHKRLQDWIASRVETAKYFASKPKTYPFAATTFHRQYSEVDPAEANAIQEALDERAEARQKLAFASQGLWRIDVKDKVVPPDGFIHVRDEILRWFAPERTLFETKKEWRSHTTDEPMEGFKTEHKEANARIEKRADGTLKAATYAIYEKVLERAVSTYDRSYFMEFDEAERLSTLYADWSSGGEGCETDRTTYLWEVSRNDAGQIDALTAYRRFECVGYEDYGTNVHYDKTVFTPAGS